MRDGAAVATATGLSGCVAGDDEVSPYERVRVGKRAVLVQSKTTAGRMHRTGTGIALAVVSHTPLLVSRGGVQSRCGWRLGELGLKPYLWRSCIDGGVCGHHCDARAPGWTAVRVHVCMPSGALFAHELLCCSFCPAGGHPLGM